MGKSTEEIKKMAKKETAKAPISPIWLGMRTRAPLPLLPSHLRSFACRQEGNARLTGHCHRPPRLRRLRWNNIRGPFAHLLWQPIVGRERYDDDHHHQRRSGQEDNDLLRRALSARDH